MEVKLAEGPMTEDTMTIPTHDPDRAKLREVLKDIEHVVANPSKIKKF